MMQRFLVCWREGGGGGGWGRGRDLVLENPSTFDALVAIQSKLPLIEFGDYDKPVWLPSNSGTFTNARA